MGAWVISLGFAMVERLGAVPDTVLAGEASVAKFPHALALHGIQVLILAWVASLRAGLGPRQQVAWLVFSGYGFLLAWSAVHTNAGRAPYDLGGAEVALAVGGVALLARAGALLVAGTAHRLGSTVRL